MMKSNHLMNVEYNIVHAINSGVKRQLTYVLSQKLKRKLLTPQKYKVKKGLPGNESVWGRQTEEKLLVGRISELNKDKI